MKITLIIGEKKESKDYSNDKTIKELLNDINMPSETVVVKKNNEIVMEDEKIENDDVIEVIKVIYGGWTLNNQKISKRNKKHDPNRLDNYA